MTVKADFRDLVITEFNSFLGDRFYLFEITEGTNYPAGKFDILPVTPITNHKGISTLANPRIRVMIFGEDYEALDNFKATFINTLSGNSNGNIEGILPLTEGPEGQEQDTELFFFTYDFRVWYRRQ